LYPTRPISIQIQADASNADGVASVTLRWSIRPVTGGTPATGSVAITKPSGSATWLAGIAPAADWPAGVMKWTVVLVDADGNQYTSPIFGQISIL